MSFEKVPDTSQWCEVPLGSSVEEIPVRQKSENVQRIEKEGDKNTKEKGCKVEGSGEGMYMLKIFPYLSEFVAKMLQ